MDQGRDFSPRSMKCGLLINLHRLSGYSQVPIYSEVDLSPFSAVSCCFTRMHCSSSK